MTPGIDFKTVVPKLDKILARGLSRGLGTRGNQVCVEAAICEALELPHGDDPKCVASDVRAFKIGLNDANWSSPEARAKGMRNLAIAQLGTKGMVGFAAKVSEKTIRILIPKLFRESFTDPSCLEAATRCETEGSAASAQSAASAAWSASGSAPSSAQSASRAAWAASAQSAASSAAQSVAAASAQSEWAAWAASAQSAASSAWSAPSSASAARRAAQSAASSAAASAAARGSAESGDKYLILAAKLALDTLREMNAPGIAWI